MVNKWHSYEQILSRLLNVEDVFKECSFSAQQRLIRKIFEAGLSFDGQIFTTSFIHPALLYRNKLKEIKTMKFETYSDAARGIVPSYCSESFFEKKEVTPNQQLGAFIVGLIDEIIGKRYLTETSNR